MNNHEAEEIAGQLLNRYEKAVDRYNSYWGKERYNYRISLYRAPKHPFLVEKFEFGYSSDKLITELLKQDYETRKKPKIPEPFRDYKHEWEKEYNFKNGKD